MRMVTQAFWRTLRTLENIQRRDAQAIKSVAGQIALI
jgi:hypothetical protein